MPKASTHSVELGRAGSSSRKFDKLVIIISIIVCAYVEIIFPLVLYAEARPAAGPGGSWTKAQAEILNAPNLAHRIVWPILAAVSIILAVRNRSRITLPPHLICLFAYLAFAGASILWAFKPEYSSTRFFQQATMIISIVLPALLAARTVDMMRGLFLCYFLALIVNLFFVLDQNHYPEEWEKGLSGGCMAMTCCG